MPSRAPGQSSQSPPFAPGAPGSRPARRRGRGTIRGILRPHPHVRPGSYGTNLPFSYYGLRNDFSVPLTGWRLEYEESGYGAEGTFWQLYDYEPFGPSYGPGCWFDPT